MKQNRIPWAVAALAILMLALAAVGPALAQSGGEEQPGQTNTPVAGIGLQAGDTLGSLAEQHQLNAASIAGFFNANLDLRLGAGQTVTFPAASGSFPVIDAGGAGGRLATGNSTGADNTGVSGMGALNRDNGASGSAVSSGSDSSTATQAGGQQATYVTQEGDTLRGLLEKMGLSSAPSGAQLVAFLNLNRGLTFADNQTLMVFPGIPQTGGSAVERGGLVAGQIPTPGGPSDLGGLDSQGSGSDGSAAAGTQPTESAPTAGAAGESSGSTYTIQAGDTLDSVAQQFGISVEELLNLNPNLLQPGQVLTVPEGSDQ